MTLYDRVSQMALSRNMSINQLEKKLKLGNGVIKRWNKSSPTCRNALSLANFLKVDLTYLLTGQYTYPNLPEEHKEILNLYEELTPERQTIVKGTLYEQINEQRTLEEKFQKESEKKILEMAKKMLTNNISIEDVISYTDLDEETVKNLHEEIIKFS